MGDEPSAESRPDSDLANEKPARRALAQRRWELGALLLMAVVAFLAFAVAFWFR
jgi:hypothetical protein